MARKDSTSAVIDSLLRFLTTTSSLAVGMVIPNALIALEKPLEWHLNTLDKRAHEREVRRVIAYMKSQGLISGDYEHGLVTTDKARTRLSKADFDNIKILQPKHWDHKWRLVFYDIPELHREGRFVLTSKLRELGFFQLQRSVWIHPFPCREIMVTISKKYGIAKFISYIETDHIDNDKQLINRFAKKIRNVSFK